MSGVLLELGKSGEHGVEKGTHAVLRSGAVVGMLRSSSWKEEATAVVGDREWAFGKRKYELIARWAVEPEDAAARVSAREESMWKGTWTIDLGGTPVDVEVASIWKGSHRYSRNGQQIAESGTSGGWSMLPTLTVDQDLPVEHAVFLLWFELVVRGRNAAVVTTVTTTT